MSADYAVVGVVAAQAALALMPKPPKTEAVAISVCAEVINALLTLAFYVLVIVVMGSIFALTKEKPEPMSGLGATL